MHWLALLEMTTFALAWFRSFSCCQVPSCSDHDESKYAGKVVQNRCWMPWNSQSSVAFEDQSNIFGLCGWQCSNSIRHRKEWQVCAVFVSSNCIEFWKGELSFVRPKRHRKRKSRKCSLPTLTWLLSTVWLFVVIWRLTILRLRAWWRWGGIRFRLAQREAGTFMIMQLLQWLNSACWCTKTSCSSWSDYFQDSRKTDGFK